MIAAVLRGALWATLAAATVGCHGSGNENLVFDEGQPSIGGGSTTSARATSTGIGASSASSTDGTGTGNSTTGGTRGGNATTTGGISGTTSGGHTSGTGSSFGTTSGGSGTTGAADSGCPCPANQFCYPQKNDECVFCIADVMCNELSTLPVCDTDGTSPNYGLCVGCTGIEPNCPAEDVCDLGVDTAGYETCLKDCRTEGRWPCGGLGAVDQTPFTHCDPVSGTCGEGCLQDNDCPPADVGPPFCDVSTGNCIACYTAADCSYANPGCYQGQCGLCGQDNDCPAGLACSAWGKCFCAGPTDCPAGMTCDLASGLCK